jgi:hypothetical protein
VSRVIGTGLPPSTVTGPGVEAAGVVDFGVGRVSGLSSVA